MNKRTKQILKSLLENRLPSRRQSASSRSELELENVIATVPKSPQHYAAPVVTELASEPNFTIEFTMPGGVRITKIKIDEIELSAEEIEELEENIADNVVKAELEVPIVSDDVVVEIEMVGEPHLKVPVKISYDGDKMHEEEVTISTDRRGEIIKSLPLP